MAYYPFRRKRNVGGIIATVLVMILLLGIVGGLAYKSEGFRNWDVKNWFANNTTEVTDGSKAEDKTDGSSVVIEGGGQSVVDKGNN